jgi:hypothetical protein
MELMSLQEYLELHQEKKVHSLRDGRECSRCNRLFHTKNLVFIMGTKIDGYGNISMNLCRKCLPYWKKEWRKYKLRSKPEEWQWSCWDIDKPQPYTEADRVFLYLQHGEFFLVNDFNPSRRVREI